VFKIKRPVAGWGGQSSGMTLLEVLIAVLLFAVFSGTFLMVTEMISQLLPADQAPAGERSCNGPALEESCVNIAFDAMVPYLEKSDPAQVNIGGDYASPNQLVFAGINDLQLAWPDAYRLEIRQWNYLPQTAATDAQASRPGLYLLQATPVSPAFWRKPIQRLFCRPYHRCVRPS
jgi:prepilin-type N-terminal cleavage/methylation domain-containing protein